MVKNSDIIIPDPEIKTAKIIEAVSKETGTKFLIQWHIIETALNVLLKLAPPELRHPAEYLDQIYDTKRDLKLLYEKEQMSIIDKESDEILEFREHERQACINCHAKPEECLLHPGSRQCYERRENYNRVQVGEPKGGVVKTRRQRINKKQSQRKSVVEGKVPDKES